MQAATPVAVFGMSNYHQPTMLSSGCNAHPVAVVWPTTSMIQHSKQLDVAS
jgi:hypothetical protein